MIRTSRSVTDTHARTHTHGHMRTDKYALTHARWQADCVLNPPLS
jgi:hypothetical protein